MVNQQESLDGIFGALANPVRRQTIAALGAGPRSASELAAPHDMTLAGFMKHIDVLREAGLVSCRKRGRTVRCTLSRAPLSKAAAWLAGREQTLNARLDALGRHLYEREQIGAKPVGLSRSKKRSSR
jgi:DNA-binding transcriptional ArsR family regulator